MSNQASYQPLTSSGQSKILIFGLLLAPTIFIVGVIPIIFLVFGTWMLRRNEDFAHMATAIRNVRIYCLLAFLICATAAAINLALYWSRETSSYGYQGENAAGWAIFAAVALAYNILAKVLLLRPMQGHEKWIETNGIFSTRAKPNGTFTKASEVDIVQGGRMSPYSVADELIKWSKLKDDGHISLDQYNAAKDKLLGAPAA